MDVIYCLQLSEKGSFLFLTKMSTLKERLQALRQQEMEAKRERKVREERVRVESEKEEQAERAEAEKLERLVREKFLPIFEEVKGVYLEEEGEITIEKRPDSYPLCPGEQVTASIILSWDYWEGNDAYGGKRLWVTLQKDRRTQLRGVGEKSPRVEFSLDDKDWREKAENGIQQILSTRGACSWSKAEYSLG